MKRSVKRSAPVLIGCALILLFGVADAIAGAAGGPPPNSKSTGPAVSGTIIIGAPGSATQGLFSIRLTKGGLRSAAIVVSSRVNGYGVGCTTDPNILANRFLGGPGTPGGLLSQYFDNAAALTELFAELGIAISPNSNLQPVMTDVENAVCSPDSTGGTLSLDVTVQFVISR